MNWPGVIAAALVFGGVSGAILDRLGPDVAAAEQRSREFTCYALVRSGAASSCVANYGDSYVVK